MQWLALLLVPVVVWALLIGRSVLVAPPPVHHRRVLGPTPEKEELLDHATELLGRVTREREAARWARDHPEAVSQLRAPTTAGPPSAAP